MSEKIGCVIALSHVSAKIYKALSFVAYYIARTSKGG
jgi:hypothetical protein